jgi:hypothetical protein
MNAALERDVALSQRLRMSEVPALNSEIGRVRAKGSSRLAAASS